MGKVTLWTGETGARNIFAGTDRFHLAVRPGPRQMDGSEMNLPDPLPLLKSPRLRLRPFAAADGPAVRELAGDPAVAATTLLIPHPYPAGAAETWIAGHEAQWAARQQLVLAITERESGALLGAIGLKLDPVHEKAEMGYWVGRPYWGQGYATEAVGTLLHHGFHGLGLNRIEAHHMAHNPASGRVMEKAGLIREGCSPQALKKDGRFVDAVFYGALRSTWLSGR
jgi:RimJ/RimL family protein N-acetyltransferase